MIGTTALLSLALLSGPQVEERVMVATNAACRAAPSRSSAAVGSFELGQTMNVARRSRPGEDAEPWLLVESIYFRGSCWVHESLTAPFDRTDPSGALQVIAEHVLASTDGRPFEDFVRVENLFRDPPWRMEPDSSSTLALLRLDLIDAAVSTEPRWEIEKDPLKMAWVLSHSDVLAYFEPGGIWVVDRAAYWALHDRSAGSELAEELAWRAASHPWMGECEGSAGCTLGTILETVAEYWLRYPSGAHLEQAIRMARSWSTATLEHCRSGVGDPGVPPNVVEEVRRSLEAVPADMKRLILEDLVEIEARCLMGGRG